MAADRSAKRIGLAIVGAGRIGHIRGKQVAERLGADFLTTDFRELPRA
jgi:hypothetical protein